LRYVKSFCPTAVAALFGSGNPFTESMLNGDSKFEKTFKGTIT
jgi:hypothetical protein